MFLILVNSEGFAYARYAAYLSGARTLALMNRYPSLRDFCVQMDTLVDKYVQQAVVEQEDGGFTLLISDSSEQAEGFLDNIRVEFEENPAIIEDFGFLPGKVWRGNVLVTKSNIKLEAIGSGKKIRGRKHRNWRPDLIILDDVENDENVRTPDQRGKLDNWFKKAVSKAGDDYTDIIYIGTLLHYDSLLANTLKNPAYRAIKYKAVISFSEADALWQQWTEIYTDLANDDREREALEFFRQHQAAMLAGTKVLWEEKLSYPALCQKGQGGP